MTENRDMMRIAARVFRADLTLQQNYRFEESATNVAIDCPLTCFDGSGDLHDQDVTRTKVRFSSETSENAKGGTVQFYKGSRDRK